VKAPELLEGTAKYEFQAITHRMSLEADLEHVRRLLRRRAPNLSPRSDTSTIRGTWYGYSWVLPWCATPKPL